MNRSIILGLTLAAALVGIPGGVASVGVAGPTACFGGPCDPRPVPKSALAPTSDVTREPLRWHMQTGNAHGVPVGAGARARLARAANGIEFAVRSKGLRPGNAYTVWVVVVNDPTSCAASPCNAQDLLLTPATNTQIVYGAGAVAGELGRARFRGALRKGPLPNGWLAGRGLEDPIDAEIHVVLNDHGPALAEYMPAMIRTYRAGCTDESLPAIFPASAKADGAPGPNTCRLTQFAVFE